MRRLRASQIEGGSIASDDICIKRYCSQSATPTDCILEAMTERRCTLATDATRSARRALYIRSDARSAYGSRRRETNFRRRTLSDLALCHLRDEQRDSDEQSTDPAELISVKRCDSGGSDHTCCRYSDIKSC